MPDFGSWTPKALGPYAWYDAHLGGYATGIRDTSAYGRPDATLGAGSNAPQWLSWNKQAQVYLPGVAGNYVSCPDAFNFTGDLEVVACVSLDDWTPAVNNTIVGQYNTSSQRSWRLVVTNTGASYVLRFSVSADGSATLYDFSSSIAPAVADGQFLWIKFTLDVDDGASGSDGRFYTAADQPWEPVSWTQLGSTAHRAATTSIFNSTAQLEIGGINGATTEPMAGVVRQVIVRNGIGGTTVADFNAELSTQTGYTDAYGNVWTVTRATTGRKSVVMSKLANSARGLYLLGTDDWITVPAAAIPPLDTYSAPSTVVVVGRRWHNGGSGALVLFSTKADSNNNTKGLAVRTAATPASTDLTIIAGDSGANDAVTGAAISPAMGARMVITAIIGNSSPFVKALVNSGASAVDTTRTTTASTNAGSAGRIGAHLNAAGVLDMEFEALLTFDRALTDTEHAQLNAYYGGGL